MSSRAVSSSSPPRSSQRNNVRPARPENGTPPSDSTFPGAWPISIARGFLARDATGLIPAARLQRRQRRSAARWRSSGLILLATAMIFLPGLVHEVPHPGFVQLFPRSFVVGQALSQPESAARGCGAANYRRDPRVNFFRAAQSDDLAHVVLTDTPAGDDANASGRLLDQRGDSRRALHCRVRAAGGEDPRHTDLDQLVNGLAEIGYQV